MKIFAKILLGIIVLAAVALYAAHRVPYWLSDEPNYRACVANDFNRGVPACTRLLGLLAKGRVLDLNAAENVSGDYWVAEILSYRGRHYIRNGKLEKGREDFRRAFELRPGDFAILNNLAEAGYTKDQLFADEAQ